VSVTGATNVTGAVTLTGAVTVGSDGEGHDLALFGTTSGSFLLWDEDRDALDVTAAVTVVGDLDLTGATALSGTLAVTGAVTAGSTLAVAGTTALAGALTVGTSAAPTTLTVNGAGGSRLAFAASNLAVTGSVTVSSSAAVTGAVTLSSTLTVSGATTLSAATTVRAPFTVGVDDVGHDVFFYGGLPGSHLHWDEDANALIVNSLEVTLNAEDAIALTGPTTVTGSLSVAGDVDIVADSVRVAGAMVVTDTATFNNATSIAQTLDVGGDVALNAGLTVQGVTRIESETVIDAVLVVNGEGEFYDNVLVDGDFTVGTPVASGASGSGGRNARFYGSSSDVNVEWRGDLDELRVNAAARFNDPVRLFDTLTLAGAATFAVATQFNDDITVAGAALLSEIELSGPLTLAGDGADLTLGEGGAGRSFVAYGVGLDDELRWDATTSALNVEGSAVAVAAPLTVTGTTSLTGAVTVTGAVSLSGGAVTVANTLTVGAAGGGNGHTVTLFGDTADRSVTWEAATDTLTVAGTLEADGPVTVTGAATLASSAVVAGALTVAGTTTLSSGVTIAGDVTVGDGDNGYSFNVFGRNSSAIAFDAGSLDVTGSATVSGDVSLGAAAAVAGSLTVGGTTTMDGATQMNGRLDVGTATAGVGFDVKLFGFGASNYAEWDASANRWTVAGSMTVTGATAFSSTVSVANLLTATGGVSVGSAGATITGPLTVGAAGSGHTTTLYGATSGSLTWASDTLSVEGALDLTGPLTAEGAVTLTGNVAISGTTFTVTAATGLQGNTAVTGTLGVTSTATLSSTVNVGSTLTVGVEDTGASVKLWGVDGSAEWQHTLNTFAVEGAVTVSAGLTVTSGNTQFEDAVYVVTAATNLIPAAGTIRHLCIRPSDKRLGYCGSNTGTCTTCTAF